jgi:hypothetical protein
VLSQSSDAGGAALGIFFVVLWLAFMAIAFGGLIFWIVQLIKVINIPDGQFRAAGTEKMTWGLVVGLLGWIGALVWYFGPRQRVLAAVGAPQAALGPAGWFPDPSGSGRQRYFDGVSWTAHLH